MNLKPMSVAMSMAVFSVVSYGATITLDRAQQRYPWNNLVDIDYTIAGLAESERPYDYTVELQVAVKRGNETTTFTASNFVDVAWCDLPSSNGTFRVTWNTTADGIDSFVGTAGLTLALKKCPVSELEAEYMIIDLAGGSTATSFPIRYVRPTGRPSSQFNWGQYKTTKLVLKRVKACTFRMGNYTSTDESNKGPKDTNWHWVTLTKDYFLGIFPITQGQCDQIQGKQRYQYCKESYSSSCPPAGPTAWQPDDYTSRFVQKGWDRGIYEEKGLIPALMAKVTTANPAGFQLPTEAQWECACRAGAETQYFWGDSPDDVATYAWYSGLNTYRHAGVGQKQPNAWGFYDMVGNVYEFCYDVYAAYDQDPAYVDGVAIDPVGPSVSGDPAAATYCMRGAYQTDKVAQMKSGVRRSAVGTSVGSNMGVADRGFRIALTLP